MGNVGGLGLGDAGGVVGPISDVGDVLSGGGMVGQDLPVPVQAIVYSRKISSRYSVK